jgi:hypothetical protein
MNADVHRHLKSAKKAVADSNLDYFAARHWERTVKQKLL